MYLFSTIAMIYTTTASI